MKDRVINFGTKIKRMSFNEPQVIDIERTTLDNPYFRQVIATSPHMQLVVMSLHPHENIGYEVHPYVTQFIRIEAGTGEARIGDEYYPLEANSAVFIPAGTWHDILNTGDEDLKLYTIYAPVMHPADRVDVYKPESD